MKNRFDGLRSILESEQNAGEEVCRRAAQLVREAGGAEAGFQVSDGPRVVFWKREPDRLRYLLNIESGAPYFVGHFPGNPILPGIIQLHWAILLARRCLDFDGPSVEIKRVKFRSIVAPPRLVELRLKPMGRGRVEFLMVGTAEVHAQGLLVFPEES